MTLQNCVTWVFVPYQVTKSYDHIITYLNEYISQISQYALLLHLQSEQNIPIMREENNLSHHFGSHKDEKWALKGPVIEKNYINFVGKSLNTENYTRNMLSIRLT